MEVMFLIFLCINMSLITYQKDQKNHLSREDTLEQEIWELSLKIKSLVNLLKELELDLLLEQNPT